jgi:hypothetical protein
MAVNVNLLDIDKLKNLVIVLHTSLYGMPYVPPVVQSDTSSDIVCYRCLGQCQCTPPESGSDDELHSPPAPVVGAHTDAQSHDLPDASSDTQPATKVDDRPADQEPDAPPQPNPQPTINLEQLAAGFTEFRAAINNQVNSASQCSQWAPVYTELAALTELLRSKLARWETHSDGVVGQGSTANTSRALHHEAGAEGGSVTLDVASVGQGGTANTSGAHHQEAGSGSNAMSSDVVPTSTTKEQKREKKSNKSKKSNSKTNAGPNASHVEDHDEQTEEVQDEDHDGEDEDHDGEDEDHDGEDDGQGHDEEEDDEEEKEVPKSELGNGGSWAEEVQASGGGTHELGAGEVVTGLWETVRHKKRPGRRRYE